MPDAPTTTTALSLIDWWLVFTSSLWILGFSVIVAAFSYHHWLARVEGRKLRQQFRKPTWSMWLAVGMTLVGVGFGLGRNITWLERTFWLVLVLSFGWQLARAVRKMAQATPETVERDVPDKRPG